MDLDPFNRAELPLPPIVMGRDRPFLRAVALGTGATHGVLDIAGSLAPCAFGRAGLAMRKLEGDGATPVGRFPLREVYYRPDRVPRPVTGLPVYEITENLGWCDDPAHPLYNQAVALPLPESHERMWRRDHLYDYLIVLGHNDDPALKGRGSAIFLHLAHDDFRPTEGCIAISMDTMRRLLPRLDETVGIVVG